MKQFIGNFLSALPWFVAVATVRTATLAAPLIHQYGMKTSEAKRTKQLDAQLIQAIIAHKRLLDIVCRNFCRTHADKEDLFQDIMCEVWVSYPKFKQGSMFSTWLYSVAMHTAIRKGKLERKHIEYRDALPEMPGDDPMGLGVDDRIDRLFGRLDEFERAIVLLLMEGYTTAEIGSILNVGAKAIALRMSRFRKEVNNY